MERPPLNLLLVEDDPNLGMMMEDFLQLHGHHVRLAQDGPAGLHAVRQQEFDLCILDVMLPKMDGFELARQVRQGFPNLPIIFLTAKSRLADKAAGFQAGADDYLTKPFSMEELLMRVQAVLRRYKPAAPAESMPDAVEIGLFRLDIRKRRLEGPGAELRPLSTKEADLLQLLAEYRNRLLPRELALKKVWGAENYYTARSMDVYISRLRKYLAADPEIRIENVHGSGYRLLA